MRNESATPSPCPPPARPACWQEIRDELFLALSNLGLNNEAASAAAERGADAAIVESRLVTLAEARRWGRPYVGAPVDRDEAERDAAMEVETDVLEISTLSTVVQLALDGIDLTRSTHQAAALHLLSDLAELGRRLATNWDAAFAKRGRAPRHTDEEGQ